MRFARMNIDRTDDFASEKLAGLIVLLVADFIAYPRQPRLSRAACRYQGVGAALAARHISQRSQRILDAGAGTGQVGVLLQILNFTNMLGIDNSTGMLEQAAVTGAYRDLARMDLLQPLDLPDGSFDHVIAIGVFGLGHVSAVAMPELIRVCRPKGRFIFSISVAAYEQLGFRESLSRWRTAANCSYLTARRRSQCIPLAPTSQI
jgi:SAM-dependent methyltransferase